MQSIGKETTKQAHESILVMEFSSHPYPNQLNPKPMRTEAELPETVECGYSDSGCQTENQEVRHLSLFTGLDSWAARTDTVSTGSD